MSAIEPRQFREDNKEETLKEQVSDWGKVESERQNQRFWPNQPTYCIMHFFSIKGYQKAPWISKALSVLVKAGKHQPASFSNIFSSMTAAAVEALTEQIALPSRYPTWYSCTLFWSSCPELQQRAQSIPAPCAFVGHRKMNNIPVRNPLVAPPPCTGRGHTRNI